MKRFLLVLALFAASKLSIGQTSGHITYNMEFSSENAEMAMGISMMEGSQMNLYFAPDKSKVDLQMGSFMKVNTVYDVTTSKGLLLMEIMGNKTATKVDSGADAVTPEKPNVTTTTETKDILGFKCIKNIVRDNEGNESVLWIAPDLKAVLKGQQQFGRAGAAGVPLEFSTTQKGMNVHFIATKFDKEVNMAVFDMTIPEGYKIVTEEEMKNMGQEG